MKPSILKQKKDQKKNIKSKPKLNIQEEPNAKFKNEVFQQLYERNNSSKGKLKTIGDEESNYRTRNDYNTPRSTSNYKDNKNSNKKSKFSNKKNYLENNNPTSQTKSKKIFRMPYNPRNYKAYPNYL